VSENLPNPVLEALAMSSTPHMVPEGAEVREAVQLPAVRVGTAVCMKVEAAGMSARAPEAKGPRAPMA